MSDTSGGNDVVAAIEVDVSVNDAAAQQQANELGQSIVGIGNKITGQATTGFRMFGSAAALSLGGVISQAEQVNRAFGTTSPLEPLENSLMVIQGPLNQFGMALSSDTEKISAMQAAGMGLAGLGGVIAGLAGGLTQLSGPLQTANAALATSISNTKNAATGAADSIANYSSQIADADKTGAQFGFASDKVNQSLSQLVEETRSAPEAFRELNFAETLSVASKMNLVQATNMVGRMHAGLFRSLRRFGIDMQSILIDPEKMATKAAEELTKATAGVQTAQENLNNYQATIAAAEQARQASWASKVQSTSDAAASAQQKYQDQLQKVADAEQKMQEASSNAQEVQTANAQKLAQDQTTAAQKVADAQQKIQDLKDQWADQDAQRAQKYQNDLTSTTQAITDAEQNLNDLQGQWSETPARTAQEQLTRLDQLRKAQEALVKAQQAQQRTLAADQMTPSQDLQRTTQMASAQRALNDAVQRQASLSGEAAKMSQQNQKAQEAAAKAAEAYALAQQHAADAQTKAADAQTKAQAAQSGEAGASTPTLAESQHLKRLQEDLDKANAAVAKAKSDQEAAVNAQDTLNKRFQEGMDQFMGREKGLLERRRQTWVGHLMSWEADVKNFAMHLGSVAAPLATIGLGVSGVGMVLQTGAKIREAISKIGDSGKDLEKGLAVGDEALSDATGSTNVLEGALKKMGMTHSQWLDQLEKSSGSVEQASSDAKDFGGTIDDLGSSVDSGASKVESSAGKVEQLSMKFGEVESAGSKMEGAIGEAGSMGRVAGAAEKMSGGIAGAATGIVGDVGEAGFAMIGPVAGIVALIAGIAIIGYEVYEHWGQISKFFKALWGDIERIAKSIFSGLVDFFKKWGLDIILLLTPVGWIGIIIHHWAAIEGVIMGFGKRVLGWAGNFGSDVVKGILGGLQDLLNIDEKMGQWMWTAIKRLWDWAWNTMRDLGSDIIKGLEHGIKSMAGSVGDTMKNFAKDAVESPFKAAMSLFSPSRVFFEHGSNIVEGLIAGIEGRKGDAKAAISSLAAGMTATGSAEFSLGVGSNMVSGSSLAPTQAGAATNISVTIPLTVQGNILTERNLQDNLKTFLQKGAQDNGGLLRFLGVQGATTF